MISAVQMDYAHFLCGFCFLLMAAVVPALKQQPHSRLAWGALAWFAGLQGAAHLMEVLALGLADNGAFRILRLAVTTVSYIVLCEFFRRAWRPRSKPGAWLYILLLVPVALGSLAGLRGAAVAVALALGLPGAVLAGRLLQRQARRLAAGRRWRFQVAALTFFVFGPAAALLPASGFTLPRVAAYALQPALLNLAALSVCTLCALTASLCFCSLGRQNRVPASYRYRMWMIPFMAVLLLAGGFFLVDWRGAMASSAHRENMLSQVTALARVLHIEHVRGLHFSEADRDNPHFKILRGQLVAYGRAIGHRSIYTQALRGGRIVFGPESLAEDDPLASAPGTPYEQPTAENLEAFRNGKAFTEGPATDEYGTFVSAFAPLIDSRTGEVLLLVGMDIDARRFQADVARARLSAIVFLFFLLGILLCGIRLFAAQTGLSQERRPVLRQVEALLLASFGLAMTIGLAYLINDFQQQSRQTIFSQIAASQAGIVSESLLCIADYRLGGLGRFIDSTPSVTPRHFSAYVAALTQDAGVYPWGWAEAGTDADDLRVACLLSPESLNEMAVGDNLSARPDWAAAAGDAVRSGAMTASDPFILGPVNRAQKGIVVVQPVFKNGSGTQTLRGFAFVVVRLWSLLNKNRALFSGRGQPPVVMGLYQLADAGMPQLLAASPLTLPLKPVSAEGVIAGIDEPLQAFFPLFVFGRAYGLSIEPGPVFFSENRLWAGWLVMLVGLLVTAVLSVFIMVLNNRRAYLERQVMARTGELQDQRQQLEDVIVGTRIGTWQWNILTGDISVNACWAEIVGYSLADMTPLVMDHVKTMVHPHDLPRFEQALDDALQGVSPLYDCEYRMRSSDGSWVWVQDLGRVMQRAFDGKPLRMSGTHADISPRKDAERALRETMEELKRSNSELEHFAYVASHDLQEPLRMVSSYLELIQRRYRNTLDSDADEFIDFAVGGARRMQTLINDLLAYSRVGTKGQPLAPTDCNEVVQRALTNLKLSIAETGAKVMCAGLPTVMADASQLTQLFQNLINNALKYRGAEAPRITIEAELKDREWLFSVQDNGIGIEPRYFERIFVIFQRLHSASEHSGTGIGLAVCKKIVERHNGIIWVSSVPGEGSTFYFSMPASQAEA